MMMKRLLLVLFLLHGCLLTPLQAVDIRVGGQASFYRFEGRPCRLSGED